MSTPTLRNNQQKVPVHNMEYIHGKRSFQVEPDLCGRLTTHQTAKEADMVRFETDMILTPGAIYTLNVPSGHSYQIVIRQINGQRVAAKVVESSSKS
jgi:hypothetical protein